MKKTGLLNNENGFFKFAFVTALIAFAMYAGIQFGMPFYRYSALKTDATELIRISVMDLDRTRGQIFERAQELKIPIEEKDIEITRTGRKIRVTTGWSEKVDIFGLYEKPLKFTIDIEE